MENIHLLNELERNHRKWIESLTMDEYNDIGEEEFSEWLQTEVKRAGL